ncbi:hypothetical protein CYMTET_23204 [Cymbomonas tetramitiformis]|uniref:Intraflagellar transport protein 46 homolog n=1 Tax=Cymbomonas tetramitiformis TaxID=36881 RepID=A0AAE0FYW1_9CHLO|nr:hypothetical protein CYMTET_23204 [Cymbomonas tetramitiformis]
MSDDDFEYGAEEYSDTSSPGGRQDAQAAPKVVANQPHDEEVTLSDDEDESPQVSPSPAAPKQAGRPGGDSPPPNVSEDDRESEDDEGVASPSVHKVEKTGSEGETTDEEEEKGQVEAGSGGGYNPDDYANLKVSDEIKELFQYIGRYKPHNHQLDTKLKPFIPDYIPAVGDIDEFIKVARPDGKPDDLGLKVLDEPAAKQSDPTVLNLQLRAISKQSNLKPMEVTSIDGADKNPRKIQNWVQSIADLHKNKPRPTVSYTKNMPDIETLMQEWPPEVEELLHQITLPNEHLDLDLDQFIKTLCNILDIPTYNNPVESLHVMFTLYLEFKNNPFLSGTKGGGEAMPANPAGADVFTMDN